MTISSESLTLLGRAAELRAAGTPWTDTATKLAVDPHQLRQLASEHSRDYERLSRRARTEFFRETFHAAFATLRDHLKSSELRVSMVAANTIVRYELARLRYGQKDASAKLEREHRRNKTTDKPHEMRNQNVQESTKVTNQQDLNAAKKITQSNAQNAPANAAPAQPAPVTPPAASPVQSATPIEKDKTSIANSIRAKQILTATLRGLAPRPAPTAKGVPPTLEGDRLITSWFAEA